MNWKTIIIVLIVLGRGSVFSQGIINRGADVWIRGGAGLRINGGYVNRKAGTGTSVVANYGALSVTGDWVNEATSEMVLTGSGSVEFVGGDQAIIGDTRFQVLSKSVSTSATLTFQAGSSTTVENSLTLGGVNGAALRLRSSSDGSQWNIAPPSTRSLRYLDVKDSENNSGTAITLETSCVNSGGNVNWTFSPTVTAWPSSATAISYGQTLSESTLNGGSVVNGPNPVSGAFVFANPAEKPPVGAASHAIKFVPVDSAFAEVSGGSIEVTVSAILATVTTAAVTNVGVTTADSGGAASSGGGVAVTARGICWKAGSAPSVDDCDGKVESGSGTGTFTCSASGLTPGIVCHLRAWAANSVGTAYGEDKVFTTLCEAPVATSATSITTGTFVAGWSSSSGASGYGLDVSSAEDFSSFVEGFNNRLVIETSQLVTGLDSGATYYYRVRAYNASEASSSNSSVITVNTLCAAPITTSATSINTRSFSAVWASSTGAVSYGLDVSSARDFSSFLEGYKDRTVNGTSQSVTGLTAGATYYYRVRAVNVAGASSANSAVVTVNTLDTRILDVPSEAYPNLATALAAANAGDTLQVAAGVYHEHGFNAILDVIIQGDPAGGTIIDAGGEGGVFLISSEASVTIRSLVVRHGAAVNGAGILNYGNAIIENCEIRDCSASQTGGAIGNYGNLSVTGSTLVDCEATVAGAAIDNSSSAALNMENCTVDNRNGAEAGPSGVRNKGNVRLDSCLITGFVTGFRTTTGFCEMTNTIVAGNVTNIDGEWNDFGHNIVTGDPGLLALGDYGGLTRTRALATGSPAMNQGETELAIDQRGVKRPQGDAADVGPFEARFHSLEFVAGANGSLSGETAQTVAEFNSATAVTALAEANYNFLNWTRDGDVYSTANPLVVGVVTEGMVLTANFAKDQYMALFTSIGEGALEGETRQTVAYQEVCSPVKAAPNSGWRFVEWKDQDGAAYADNPIVYGPMEGSAELTAFFERITYTIGATHSSGGTCRPDGEKTINAGDSLTIQIAPAGGFYTQDVSVDGESIGVASSYTFKNVSRDHVLHADFVEIPATVWKISASEEGEGTISPVGEVAVEDGSSVTFSMSPDESWRIADVEADGDSQGAVDSFTFENVGANHVIHAVFERIPIQTFVITASAGEGGAVEPTGENQVNQGQSKTFTVQADDGYDVRQVLVDGVSIGVVSSFTFHEVSANHAIHAEFSKEVVVKHSISAKASQGGRISPSGAVSVVDGNDATFTITPESGWSILDVIVDGASVSSVSSYRFQNVTGDHSIQASFTPITHVITTSSTEGGEVDPGGEITVNQGDSETFSLVPDGGCYLTDVVVDGKSVGAVSTYAFSNITANHSIHARFAKTPDQFYQITSSASSGGTISPSGNVRVREGRDAVFAISADEGYLIEDVQVDGASVGGVVSYTFENLASDHEIHADFKVIPVNQYVVSAASGKGGTIAPDGQVLVEEGSRLTLTITPDPLYQIADVLVDASSVGAVTTHVFENIDSNHQIMAEFTPVTHVVTALAGDHGVVAPSGETEVNAGDSLVFVFRPDAGYHVENVVIDGTSHGEIVEYEFTDIRSDHLLSVSFAAGEEVRHVIRSSSSNGGTISPLGRTTVRDGGTARFTILPQYGSKVKDVLIDDVSVGVVESYEFVDITDDHSISAIFETDESGGGDLVLGVSVNDAKGGWLTPKPGKYAVERNAAVRLEAMASDDYVFEGWSAIGDVTLAEPRSRIIEFNATGPTEITANFAAIEAAVELVVRPTPTGSGSLSPEGTVLALAGEPQQIMATAAADYEFNQWVITQGVGTVADVESSLTTLTPSADTEVVAAFTHRELTVDVEVAADGPGVVEPQGVFEVPLGTVLDLTALAATGHAFTRWESNAGGLVVSPYSSKTKVIVTDHCQLTARFLASDQVAVLTLNESDADFMRTENWEKGTRRLLRARVPSRRAFVRWDCQTEGAGASRTTCSAIANAAAPVTTIDVDQDATVVARFVKNRMTESAAGTVRFDARMNMSRADAGGVSLSFFPCSRGPFDPLEDELTFRFNDVSYVFPEDAIRRVGDGNVWKARLKREGERVRICLDLDKGEFGFRGKKLTFSDYTLNEGVNCSLVVGERSDCYRLTPQTIFQARYHEPTEREKGRPDRAGDGLKSFSVHSAIVRVGSKDLAKNHFKIPEMSFSIHSGEEIDPSAEEVAVRAGDLCVTLAPGAFKALSRGGTYACRDKENGISIFLDVLEGRGRLAISGLAKPPSGCETGSLDVFLRVGRLTGETTVMFDVVDKRFYLEKNAK